MLYLCTRKKAEFPGKRQNMGVNSSLADKNQITRIQPWCSREMEMENDLSLGKMQPYFLVRLSQQKGYKIPASSPPLPTKSYPCAICLHAKTWLVHGEWLCSSQWPAQCRAPSNMTPISWMNAVIDTALRALCLVSRQFNMEGGGGQNNYSGNRIF